MSLTVVAEIAAKPGCEEELKQLLIALVGAVREEEGCLQYDLHQSAGEPGKFLFFENWRDSETLRRHGASEHMKAFGQRAAPLIDGRSRVVMYSRIA